MSRAADERAGSVTETARSGAPGAEHVPSARARISGESASAAEPAGASHPQPSAGPSGRVREALRDLRRFARGVLGSDAYDRYAHHHRITGCEHPLLSEREFWRAKHREQDENPGARCC